MSTTTGIPIGQLPVLGAVTDDSYVVGEHAGSGLFSALALKSYGTVNTNYLDNSGFAVNQRGYTSGTALAAGAFGHDRWKGGASGGTYTFTASPPSTVITITTGSLQQVVDGTGLLTGSYTLSWTGTAQGRVGAGAYAASPVAVTAATGTNLTVEFNAGTVSRVKLEVGSIATAWQADAPQVTLARCQRYFQAGGSVRVTGYQTAGNGITATQSLPCTMRAIPTIATQNFSGSNVSSTALTALDVSTLQIYTGTFTATGVGNVQMNYTASADL